MVAEHMTPSTGSALQMFASTTPILGVLSYFLYLAYQRPQLERYNLADDVDDLQISSAYADPIIALIEMLYVFLALIVSWSWMLVYLLVFIPKRRKLIKRYFDKDVKSVLGDVAYEEYNASGITKCLSKFFRCDYAYVTYTLDRKMCDEQKAFEQNVFQAWLSGSQIDEENARSSSSNVTGVVVQRKIRTYLPFDREQVTILILPNKPRSGVPRTDIETDLGTQDGRGSIKLLLGIVIFWLIFCISGSLYILSRMAKVDDDYENDELGWRVFSIFIGVVVPATSIGLNWLRYIYYKYWLVDQGAMRPVLDGSSIGGNYVCIS